MLGSDAFTFLIGEEEDDVFSNCERRGPRPRLFGGTIALVGDVRGGGGEVVLRKVSTVLALLAA
jgi:hypothetical protein